ncbi:DEAD/DEAH box helicase [Phyllobacterium salinisoli]|uniref:DEAD/DEAH box helicase n=1 Tax=Phyllobacterium salinisoli TaxID=1899321 RepID=UPI001FE19679|nr:DEAD/DEAH box helicase [Phyllobacterium salinisoli]
MRTGETRPPPKEIKLENTETSGFAALGITGVLLKATENAGMTAPKPIQQQSIPAQIEGRDILGIAQTGSGKTAAFSLPILSKIIGLGDKRKAKTARALILAPTRELAVQIEETIRTLSKGAHVSTALVLGGVSRLSQIKKMQAGVDVLIATPGRLTDLVRENCIDLSDTRWLVLDEADRMLDMGFINDVKRIAKATRKDRQTALFSATMPQEIAALAASLLRDPVRVEVAPQGTTVAEITQVVHPVVTKEKKRVLSGMLTNPAMASVIVFTRTKHGADAVTRNLERDGFVVAAIHGNKSQNARQRALNGFKDGSVRILVATDIAARGIDVVGISHVVNYDLPDEPESYVHRIGRTGRNGASGAAITLYDPGAENAKLKAVERVIRMKLPMKDAPAAMGPVPVGPSTERAESSSDRTSDSRNRSKSGQRPGQKSGQKFGQRDNARSGGERREGRSEAIWTNDGAAPRDNHGDQRGPQKKKPFRRKSGGGARAA